MQIKKEVFLINNGPFSKSKEASQALQEIKQALLDMRWPVGSPNFQLNSTRMGNGVNPVKDAFVDDLELRNWILEYPLGLKGQGRPGPLDAVKIFENDKKFAVEWETGNISSTHRALNKMSVALMQNLIKGGVLVLPSRAMAKFFTDRIGNFEEIEPYFPVWQSWPSLEGVLAVFVIEHDGTDDSIPTIKKGTDGHALLGLAKSNLAKKAAPKSSKR